MASKISTRTVSAPESRELPKEVSPIGGFMSAYVRNLNQSVPAAPPPNVPVESEKSPVLNPIEQFILNRRRALTKPQKSAPGSGENVVGSLSSVEREARLKALSAYLEFSGVAENERAKVVKQIEVVIARATRPKWSGRLERGGQLATLSAPLFLKHIYADLVEPDGSVSHDDIKAIDADLMRAVDLYIAQRKKRKLDLGDAKGLIFVASRPEPRFDAVAKETAKYGPWRASALSLNLEQNEAIIEDSTLARIHRRYIALLESVELPEDRLKNLEQAKAAALLSTTYQNLCREQIKLGIEPLPKDSRVNIAERLKSDFYRNRDKDGQPTPPAARRPRGRPKKQPNPK